MPNLIAYGALLLWPLVTCGLFLMLSTQRAIIWSLLIAYLFLPIVTRFDFPGLPSFDKLSIPALSTLIFALIMSRRGEFQWPKSRLLNILVAIFLFSPIVTGFLNRDSIVILDYVRNGIDFYTSMSEVLDHFVRVIPFILGVGFLRTERSHRDLLMALVIGALIYSIPILIEIRLSPQLHKWIYGATRAGAFVQQLRDGGFRSMAFLGHGLLVSNYLAFAIIAAAGLTRMRGRIWSIPAGLVLAYLVILLILNKSLGAVVLVALLAPAVYWLRPRRLMMVALLSVCLVLSFPVARTLGLVPVNLIETVAGKVSSERAQSYAFRIMNEESLLARAEERPIFGWGGFGRSRVRIITSYGTVEDVSTTDGQWIIVFGTYGWVGFIGMFGLICYPLLRAYKIRKQQPLPPASLPLVGLILYSLLNFLPNSGETPLIWLVAGSLAGLVAPQARRAMQRRPAPHMRAPAALGEPAPV